MKEQLTKLLKVKSITTFIFLGLIVYSVVAEVKLAEWLIAIITMVFKELFDKDKVKQPSKNEEEE